MCYQAEKKHSELHGQRVPVACTSHLRIRARRGLPHLGTFGLKRPNVSARWRRFATARAVAPTLLASCLLAGARPAAAADKIKIEIVEATTTIGLVPHTFAGTPERIQTHCDIRTDVNCNSTVIPGTAPSSDLLPQVLLFEVKAILPDHSHLTLICIPSVVNKKCGGIIPVAGSTPDSMSCFLNAMANPEAWGASASVAGATKTCTTTNLGFYRGEMRTRILSWWSTNLIENCGIRSRARGN